MNLNRETYIAKIRPGTIINDTGLITVQPVQALPYEVALIHLMLPEETQSTRNIYFDVLGITGRPQARPVAMKVAWRWDGQHSDEVAPPALFEKLPPEPGANIALGLGQVATVWLEDLAGHALSGTLSGFRTNLPGDGNDARPGHNSFYVIFRPSFADVTVPIIPTTGFDYKAALIAMRDILKGVGL